MPRFSICISVFNGERYLRACIDSVLNQSFSDYELIIVDDASSDGSAAILEEYAENDKRITVVRKSQNEGLHLGHRTAIEKCSGDYILFLDADDEFEEGLLGKVDGALREDQQIDMLHFGIRVIGEGVSDESCSSFESFVNQPVETLEGVDILSSVFGGRGSYRQDWRMPQRAFSARLLKDAFSKMPVQRLDCAEDAFEMFVISSLASKEVTRNDIIGIRYHLGRGLRISLRPLRNRSGRVLAKSSNMPIHSDRVIRLLLQRAPSESSCNFCLMIGAPVSWTRRRWPQSRKYLRCLILPWCFPRLCVAFGMLLMRP